MYAIHQCRSGHVRLSASIYPIHIRGLGVHIVIDVVRIATDYNVFYYTNDNYLFCTQVQMPTHFDLGQSIRYQKHLAIATEAMDGMDGASITECTTTTTTTVTASTTMGSASGSTDNDTNIIDVAAAVLSLDKRNGNKNMSIAHTYNYTGETFDRRAAVQRWECWLDA